jgi:hypothetical protein
MKVGRETLMSCAKTVSRCFSEIHNLIDNFYDDLWYLAKHECVTKDETMNVTQELIDNLPKTYRSINVIGIWESNIEKLEETE